MLFDIYQCIDLFKVIIQPPPPFKINKNTILWRFTDPQVIPKWYDFLLKF